ncbi:hypothetical protein INR49_011043 [Caranx melampygus]|nr:hypothetical protein INR49_011043 [Caranx melampygus]
MVLSSVEGFGLLGARCEENYLKEKMAEKHSEAKRDGCESVTVTENHDEDQCTKDSSLTSKRCSSTSPSTAPPHKSPRTDSLSPAIPLPDSGEGNLSTDKQEMQMENTEEPPGLSVSPTPRRKSWRRATITRRSLPALSNPYQVLCRSISTSSSPGERLEKLMEASMKMDTQCKMVRELLSIKEQSQLLVKETSGRLAAEAGFQDLSPDPIRNLLAEWTTHPQAHALWCYEFNGQLYAQRSRSPEHPTYSRDINNNGKPP